MFKRRERSDEEINQKRIDLEKNLTRAELARKGILNEKVSKLRVHYSKVQRLKESNAKKKHEKTSMKDYSGLKTFLSDIDNIQDSDGFKKFMVSSASIQKAENLVTYLESQSLGSDSHIKHKPKIFMSIALLDKFPHEVVGDEDEAEKNITMQSKNFMKALRLFFRSEDSLSKSRHEMISTGWKHVIDEFDRWMTKDKNIVFEKMKEEFISWVRTVGSMSLSDPARREWEEHALKHQNQILKSVFQVFGKPYVENLAKQVEEMNREFIESKMHINFEEKDERYVCEWVTEIKDEQVEDKSARIDKKLLDKVKSTNIHILHEIMLSESFLNFDKILEMSGKSLEEISAKNREGLKRFASSLESNSNSKSISYSLQELFKFICKSLIELAGDNEDYVKEIKLTDCSINENGWLEDTEELFRWILSMCKRCCAPARDNACAEIEHYLELIHDSANIELAEYFENLFTMVLDLLNLMRGDYCNFHLRKMVTQIEGKGIAEMYELEELKKRHPKTFKKTIDWIVKSYDPNKQPLDVLIDAYLKFFEPGNENLTCTTVPETFYLDAERLNSHRLSLENNLRRKSIIIYLRNSLNTSNFSANDLETFTEDFKKRLNESEHLMESVESLLKESKLISMPSYEFLKSSINNVMKNETNDKVYEILKERSRSEIRAILTGSKKTGKDELIDKICRLFNYNKSCFGSIYDEIISKLQKNN